MPTDLYGGNVVKPFLGRVVLKKLAGAGPVAAGTQVVIPHASALPRNPLNTSYLAGVSSSAYLSADLAGKRTPSCIINTVVKATSFFTADLINSLLISIDSNGDTDVWAILLDDLYSPQVYDGAKCHSLQLRQYAKGGPMTLSFAFAAMYGDSENTGAIFTPTSFSATSSDPGPITDVSKISYSGTADLVQSFSMDLARPQSYVFYDDGTDYPAGIASGVFTGVMALTQSVKYSASWGSSGTVNIGQSGAGVAISASLDRMNDVKEFKGDSRTVVRTYQLFSGTGAAPVTFSAM